MSFGRDILFKARQSLPKYKNREWNIEPTHIHTHFTSDLQNDKNVTLSSRKNGNPAKTGKFKCLRYIKGNCGPVLSHQNHEYYNHLHMCTPIIHRFPAHKYDCVHFWHLPFCMISTSVTILSICFLAAIKPCSIKILKYSNISLPRPPITCCKEIQLNITWLSKYNNKRRYWILCYTP